jgi:hypothetical protein
VQPKGRRKTREEVLMPPYFSILPEVLVTGVICLFCQSVSVM